MQPKWFGLLKNLVGISSSFLILFGCTQKSCRQPLRTYQGSVANNPELPAKDKEKDDSLVYVYKYDGSLQCEKVPGLTLSQMKKQLQGIEVMDSEKRHDGLMHLQVCGSRTGQTNVYLISMKDLELAQKKGFKVWDFK